MPLSIFACGLGWRRDIKPCAIDIDQILVIVACLTHLLKNPAPEAANLEQRPGSHPMCHYYCPTLLRSSSMWLLKSGRPLTGKETRSPSQCISVKSEEDFRISFTVHDVDFAWFLYLSATCSFPLVHSPLLTCCIRYDPIRFIRDQSF